MTEKGRKVQEAVERKRELTLTGVRIYKHYQGGTDMAIVDVITAGLVVIVAGSVAILLGWRV